MLDRLAAVTSVLRPRALARTAKSVEDLLVQARDLRRAVKALEQQGVDTIERTSTLERELREARQALDDVGRREAQLRAVYQRDIEQEGALRSLDPLLRPDLVRPHVERALARASVERDPFPHAVVTELLPRPLYDAVVAGIPPVALFDGAPNKQRLVVPFGIAPAFSRRVWGFLLEEVIDGVLGPALARMFREPMAEWLRATWPGLGPEAADSALQLHNTDGRILLRGRGYVIPPHRDPKWGFLTCLLYLARPGDDPSWGTQLYSVEGDTEAASVAPHWIRPEQCRLERDVLFRPNTALVFLNSRGAHGARIPADAEPADLERYIYQFRIGPTADSIRRLVAMLPDERRTLWSGKVADYA